MKTKQFRNRAMGTLAVLSLSSISISSANASGGEEQQTPRQVQQNRQMQTIPQAGEQQTPRQVQQNRQMQTIPQAGEQQTPRQVQQNRQMQTIPQAGEQQTPRQVQQNRQMQTIPQADEQQTPRQVQQNPQGSDGTGSRQPTAAADRYRNGGNGNDPNIQGGGGTTQNRMGNLNQVQRPADQYGRVTEEDLRNQQNRMGNTNRGQTPVEQYDRVTEEDLRNQQNRNGVSNPQSRTGQTMTNNRGQGERGGGNDRNYDSPNRPLGSGGTGGLTNRMSPTRGNYDNTGSALNDDEDDDDNDRDTRATGNNTRRGNATRTGNTTTRTNNTTNRTNTRRQN